MQKNQTATQIFDIYITRIERFPFKNSYSFDEDAELRRLYLLADIWARIAVVLKTKTDKNSYLGDGSL